MRILAPNTLRRPPVAFHFMLGRLGLALGCLLALGGGIAWSQPSEVIVDGPDESGPEELRKLGPQAFRTIRGSFGAVRYTAALDRAHHVLQRIDVSGWYFKSWSDLPTPTAVYLMNRDEWTRAGVTTPYGLPLRAGSAALLAPAAGDPETVQFWQQLLGDGGLPRLDGHPLVGSDAEAATLLAADTLLQVEIARGFANLNGLRGREGWISELVAHVVAGTVAQEHEASRVEDIALFYQRLGSRLAYAAGPPENYSPALVLQDEQGVEAFLWYQAQFHRGASIVLRRDGSKAMNRILKMWKKKRGLLEVADLIDRYPELEGWLANFGADGSASTITSGSFD